MNGMDSTVGSFVAPDSLQQALELLDGQRVVMAGGTDLWPTWNAEGSRPRRVLSLHRLQELRGIQLQDGAVRVGATSTHGDLARSELVQEHCPALAQAAATVGAVQIQNRGTIGGNLVNASPAADLPPPLVAAGADVELVSARGTRQVPLDRFFTGYRQIDRHPDELLVAVHVPVLAAGAHEEFIKVGTRRAQAISKVMGACRLQLDDQGAIVRAGISFGSVAPTVVRLERVEQWLVGRQLGPHTAGEAEAMAADSVSPIDDLRSSAEYRRYVVGRLVNRWISGRILG